MENRRKRQYLGENGKPQYLNQIQYSVAAAMKANSYGELPLHFAAMRGESTRSLRAIVQVAPEAVFHRDTNSFTPLHWLVIRWVDTTLERFGIPTLIDDIDDTVSENEDYNPTGCLSMISHSQSSYDNDARRQYPNPKAPHKYKSSTNKSSADVEFDFEYHVRTNAIDPPVDYRYVDETIISN